MCLVRQNCHIRRRKRCLWWNQTRRCTKCHRKLVQVTHKGQPQKNQKAQHQTTTQWNRLALFHLNLTQGRWQTTEHYWRKNVGRWNLEKRKGNSRWILCQPPRPGIRFTKWTKSRKALNPRSKLLKNRHELENHLTHSGPSILQWMCNQSIMKLKILWCALYIFGVSLNDNCSQLQRVYSEKLFYFSLKWFA